MSYLFTMCSSFRRLWESHILNFSSWKTLGATWILFCLQAKKISFYACRRPPHSLLAVRQDDLAICLRHIPYRKKKEEFFRRLPFMWALWKFFTTCSPCGFYRNIFIASSPCGLYRNILLPTLCAGFRNILSPSLCTGLFGTLPP